MGHPIIVPLAACRRASELDGLFGDLRFGQSALAGDPFDGVAVLVSCRERHRAIDVRWIRAQRFLDDADVFDEIAPVDCGQEAETRDAVADRHLVRCLTLILRLDQLLDRPMRFPEPLLDPGQRERQRRGLALQSARELRHERARHRRQRSSHVRDDQDEAFRIPLRGRHHAIGPDIGEITLRPAGGDVDADAPEVFDQRESQHDRDRPELTELQRGHRLVCGDEAVEAVGVDPAVAMRDRRERDVIDARQTCRWTGGQAWELAAVPAWQVPPGRADLFFDQMEVVEKPFASRTDPLIGRCCGRQAPGDVDQDDFVRGEPREQLIARTVRASGDARRRGSCRTAPSDPR